MDKKKVKDSILSQAITPKIDLNIFDRVSQSIDSVFDPSYWVLRELDVDLYDNQIQILENVVDLKVKYLAIIGARSSGKSFGVAAGLIKLCQDVPGIQICVFGPKAAQAIRLLDEIMYRILNDKTKERFINKDRTNKSFLVFRNGSTILAQSAAEETEGEGFHGDVLVIDESQRVSDFSFSQRLAPMISSSSIGKIIQLGVPLYKGHFWKAFNNPQYVKLIYSWRNCPKLFQAGTLLIDGVRYPRVIIEQMPKSIKIATFPTHPELWFESTTQMSEEDFWTQYEMQWLENLRTVLTEEDQIRLASGTHSIANNGSGFDELYFGLDFAGGEVVGNKEKSDFTALTIWRKSPGNVKEKIFAKEWKGDLSQQAGDILSYIHPKNGVFRCKFGLADYGNMGAAVVDILKAEGVPIEGLFFQGREPHTGKNFKNAMVDNFVFELRNDRVKYPTVVNPKHQSFIFKDEISKLFKKHFDEWCSLEKLVGTGLNAKIKAPDELHDDGSFSDSLAVFAADGKFNPEDNVSKYKLPSAVKGGSIFGHSSLNTGTGVQQFASVIQRMLGKGRK